MDISSINKIFDMSGMGLLVEDADRKIKYTNQKFIELMEIDSKPEDMVGFDCALTAKYAKHLFANPDKFEYDIIDIPKKCLPTDEIIKMANGSYFKRMYSAFFLENGSHDNVWIYQDVTTTIEKSLEIERQKEFYLNILNEIPADIAIFNDKHKYLYLNRIAVENEETRNWLIGKDDFEYCEHKNIDTKLATLRRSWFNDAVNNYKPFQKVDEIKKADGTVKYVLRIFHPIYNEQNELTYVVGYGIDITDQYEAALFIENQNLRFKKLINELTDGVFQIGVDGKLIFYNIAILDIIKSDANNLLDYFDFKIIDNLTIKSRDNLYKLFKKVAATQTSENGTIAIEFKDKSVKYIDYYFWFSTNPVDGNCVIGRISDATLQKLRENDLKSIINKEKELNSLKSHFINITSHELRTPIAVIMSSAEIIDMILSKPNLDQKIKPENYTTKILAEVNKITDILNDLLIVGQIESGKIKFKPEPVSIKEYIEKIIEENFSTYKDGRKLDYRVQEDGRKVQIDKNLMRHVILNLIGNAFKYSPNKAAPILDVLQTSNELKISVKDFGIGIPEKDIENLFETFYRASNVGNISGTGLGLLIVEHAIQTHKGRIEVNSIEGEGTTISIYIPINNLNNTEYANIKP
jgi:signal transduction histidine kinase/PAS domain-containing protein